MVGIVLEQHPERARLFMQWKEMGWPVLVDSLDLLELSVVPVTVLIDEYGVVRRVRARAAEADRIEAEFLEREFEPPAVQPVSPVPPDLAATRAIAEASGDARLWQAHGDAAFVWRGAEGLEESAAAYREAGRIDPGLATGWFRLGVALRARYDGGDGRPADFQAAVDAWSSALDLDPNQYIVRRRIQQYGPRLDKPYPFYDWVETARDAILARGERPVPLPVEPGGAEFAAPATEFRPDPGGEVDPDPDGRIHRDQGEFVRVEATVVPGMVGPGEAARVHVAFRPDGSTQAHWNNEAGDLVVWLDPPEGWAVDRRRLSVPNPADAVSDETRRVELELRAPEDAAGATVTVPAHALYYVCEGERGACLYRRQDFRVGIRVLPLP